MNILKISESRFEEVIIDIQKELGIRKTNNYDDFNNSVKKLIRPENFLFNSYVLRLDGFEYKVNRLENTFSYGTADRVFVRVKIDAEDAKNAIYTATEVSGTLYDELRKKRNMPESKKNDMMTEGVYNTVIPVICFERYIMKLMESRAVTITDLSDIQKVTKVNKPQPKKNKKNKSRPSKEITLNFSDIEKVVYAKPEVHVPRSYERHTESWEVRGYVRHYKSGKTVFVKPYTKGKKTEKPSEDKVYNVKI